MTLMTRGFPICVSSRQTVREFMIRTLGMKESYVEDTVRTVFHNGSPVDDIDAIHVNPGDTVALAAAMPGLVGIAMGRNTAVSCLRDDISARDEAKDFCGSEKPVTVKLFNLVAKDMAEKLLAEGLEFCAGLVSDAIAAIPEKRMSSLELEGERISKEAAVSTMAESDSTVVLQVL